MPVNYSPKGPVEVEPSVLEHILTTLRSLDEAIRGNGKPGLKQDMSTLRTEFVACRAVRDLERQNKDKVWTRLIHPAVVIVYGGIAILLITGFGTWMSKRMQVDIAEQVQMVIQAEDGRPGHK